MKHYRLAAVFFLLSVIMLMPAAPAAPKATREELNAVALRLERLERALDNQMANAANKQALITLQGKLTAMQRELQVLRGENESLRNQLDQYQRQQRESMLVFDRRLQGVQITTGQQAAGNTPAIQSAMVEDGTTAEQITPREVRPLERQTVVVPSETFDSSQTIDAYRDAFLLLKQRRYNEAISAFENFLSNYPNSKYSANAQYWLAEANYVTRRYERALEEFNRVVSRYPASSKVPDARLKIGYTQYELEQYPQARITFTRLRAQFPNSTVPAWPRRACNGWNGKGTRVISF